MRKTIKKLAALLLAGAMTVGVTAMAGAQTVGTASEGTGSITINNAAKGETYGVVKLFDAKVNGDGGITYTGTIPDSLKGYFEEQNGNVVQKDGVSDAELLAAVQTWAEGQTATAQAESDGSALTFAGLAYGYYAVKSTQGAVISVDSTNTDASIYDKNSSEVEIEKTVEKTSYSIGDTVKYTATFDTVTYLGEGEAAKQVTKYVISDTLPEFLSDVVVTSIKVGETELAVQQFDDNKSITIPWVEGTAPNLTSLYENGAKLEIKYEGKLTSVTNINADDTNTVSIQPYVWDEEEKPWNEHWEDDAVIRTYAAAVEKIDGTTGETLAGAEFTIKGLTVTEDSEGVYTVVSYNPSEDAQESAVLKTDENGRLYIVGLADDVTLTVTEYKAPDGYNKLDAPVEGLKAALLSETVYKASGDISYDAKGNVVSESSSASKTETVVRNLEDIESAQALVIENFAGTELPHTGGMGTTLFYVIGGILVAAAAIILVSRRRVAE